MPSEQKCCRKSGASSPRPSRRARTKRCSSLQRGPCDTRWPPLCCCKARLDGKLWTSHVRVPLGDGRQTQGEPGSRYGTLGDEERRQGDGRGMLGDARRAGGDLGVNRQQTPAHLHPVIGLHQAIRRTTDPALPCCTPLHPPLYRTSPDQDEPRTCLHRKEGGPRDRPLALLSFWRTSAEHAG